MNRQELEKDLIALGVKPGNYTLNGPPYHDSSWVLESVYDRKKAVEIWSVFNFERGKRYDEEVFITEDEACKYIYKKLKTHQELVIKFKVKDW